MNPSLNVKLMEKLHLYVHENVDYCLFHLHIVNIALLFGQNDAKMHFVVRSQLEKSSEASRNLEENWLEFVCNWFIFCKEVRKQWFRWWTLIIPQRMALWSLTFRLDCPALVPPHTNTESFLWSFLQNQNAECKLCINTGNPTNLIHDLGLHSLEYFCFIWIVVLMVHYEMVKVVHWTPPKQTKWSVTIDINWKSAFHPDTFSVESLNAVFSKASSTYCCSNY